MSIASPSRSSSPSRPRAGMDPHGHETAVVQAEARRLALALAPYRVLRKPALERVSGAVRWHEGGFERALTAAVRAGMIERLPAGFYRQGRAWRRREV